MVSARRIAVLLILVVATAGACGGSEDTRPPPVEKSVEDLRPGDCFDGTARAPASASTGTQERTVLVVNSRPCSDAHDKEVFAVFEHPKEAGFVYPGERDIRKVAQDGCADRFPAYIGGPFEDSDLQVSVIAPGPVPWDEGDRTIVCTVQADRPLKGSQKGTGS